MSKPEIDPVLHPPARLQIAALLSKVDDAEFARLRDILDVSDSVLSKHLSALADAGYVAISKARQDGRQRTWAKLTHEGKRAFAAHLQALQDIVSCADLLADDDAVESSARAQKV